MLAWTWLPPEIADPATFLLIGSLSAMLSGMAKAGFGGSAGMLSVPLMIYACGENVALANGILLPILIAADYVATIGWLGKWNLRAVAMMLPGTVLGIAAGWALLHVLNGAQAASHKDLTNAALKIGVGAISLGFVALQMIRSLRSRPLAFRPVFWQGTVAGSASGFCSTLAHAAGPIVTMYLLPQRMPKGRYVASTALFFWIANQIKLVPYFSEGMIDTSTLGAGVLLVPAIAGGAILGILLHRRVGQKPFNAIVYALLALAGLHLCIKGIGDLLAG